MLSDPQRQHVKLVARTLQIIIGTLVAGVISFLGVVLVLASREGAIPPPNPPFITYTAVILTAIDIIVWAIVPAIIASRMRNSLVAGKSPAMAAKLPNAAELGDVGPLTVIYQTRTIVAAAMLEGAAFLNLIAYFLERQTVCLAVAGTLLLMLLSHFPTVSRLESRIESALIDLTQLRQLGQ
jgi:hypothetical protein